MSITVKDGNGVDQTLDPTTAANQTTLNTYVGALTETAPASDTASSGVNGRLQRIAQRITSLIALLPASLGAGGGLKVEGVTGGTALPTLEQSRAASSSDVHAPASNTAAVVTYAAAGAGVAHVIGGVAWSYNATPTAGNLKIEDGAGNIVFTVDVTTSGAGGYTFPRPKKGTANTAFIITLAAGGSGVSGKVSVLSHWTE